MTTLHVNGQDMDLPDGSNATLQFALRDEQRGHYLRQRPHHATVGVRMCDLPFTADKLQAALSAANA